MKQIVLHITYLIIVLLSFQVIAQDNNMKGYRIEGDEIIFVFNREDYDKISNDEHHNRDSFENLNIENVVVAGNLNNWSKDQWQMKKTDNGIHLIFLKLISFQINNL